MANYVSQSANIAVGKGVKKSLIQGFDDGLVDHETRIGNIQAASNRIPIFEYYIDPQNANIGDIKHAKMTLAQWTAQNGNGWQLCNGGPCTNTAYDIITGQSSVPNLIGQKKFVRSASSDVIGLGSGEVGSVEDDTTAINGLTMATDGAHNHGSNVGSSGPEGPDPTFNFNGITNHQGSSDELVLDDFSDHTHGLTGDTETRPTNISLNYFIKTDLSAMDNVISIKVRDTASITAVKGYVIDANGLPTASGSFEFDIRKSSTTRASLSSIFTTKPIFTGIPTDGETTDSGTFTGGGASLTAGDWLSLDVTSVISGTTGFYIQVFTLV